jgi:hypothetical protein
LEKDYRDIATVMRIPGRDVRDANALKLVCDWLNNEANGKWVIIINDADDIAVLDAMPPSHLTRTALYEVTDMDEESVPKVIELISSS